MAVSCCQLTVVEILKLLWQGQVASKELFQETYKEIFQCLFILNLLVAKNVGQTDRMIVMIRLREVRIDD